MLSKNKMTNNKDQYIRRSLQNWFSRSSHKAELMAKVWHPRNSHKFAYLDPDTFGELVEKEDDTTF